MAVVGATIMEEAISCNDVIKNLAEGVSSMMIIYKDYCWKNRIWTDDSGK